MGIRVNRIEKEFILKKILENGTLVKILSNKKEIEGKIAKFEEDYLIIDCLQHDISHIKEHDEVSIFFIFENNQHTFSTKIKEKTKNQLIIVQPEKTYKSLQRQYERVKSTENIKVFFTLKGKRIELDFPKTDNYHPIMEPAIAENLDTSNIYSLIKEFRGKMKKIVSVNKIIMLRNRLAATFEEKIMAKTGKIIWIPIINNGFLIKHQYPELNIITYQEITDYEIEKGTQRSGIGIKLESIIKEKLNKGFYSQLYCPILYNEYFVGYIYLCNFSAKKTEISIDILQYVSEFSQILCYSLKTNHYFTLKELQGLSYSSPIIDLSASGLLFAHSEKYISIELPLHSDITITLKIGKRKMEIGSQVIRKHKDKNLYYFALKFMDITREDFRFLYEYIYGKPYSIEASKIW